MSKDYIPAFNYDFLTPLYDFFIELAGYGKRQRIKVVNLLNLNSAKNLLDVGCGTGTLLTVAKEKYPQVEMVGVDIDQNVLSIARKKAYKTKLDIDYIEISSAKLPFVDSSFDVVVSSLVFHHLPTEIKQSSIKEIYRVLKRDGIFLLADFGKKEGLVLYLLDFITKFLNLPESKTLQDNLEGKLPIYLRNAKFQVIEVTSPYRGIHFIKAAKL